MKIKAKRGMAPFISTIIIIAFVLGLSVLIYHWLVRLTSSRSNVAYNRANANCEYFHFYVDSAYYYPLKKQLVIKIVNDGQQPFKISEIDIFNSTFYRQVYLNNNFLEGKDVINGGASAYVILGNVINNVTMIRVIPSYCQQLAVSFNQIQYVD